MAMMKKRALAALEAAAREADERADEPASAPDADAAPAMFAPKKKLAAVAAAALVAEGAEEGAAAPSAAAAGGGGLAVRGVTTAAALPEQPASAPSPGLGRLGSFRIPKKKKGSAAAAAAPSADAPSAPPPPPGASTPVGAGGAGLGMSPRAAPSPYAAPHPRAAGAQQQHEAAAAAAALAAGGGGGGGGGGMEGVGVGGAADVLAELGASGPVGPGTPRSGMSAAAAPVPRRQPALRSGPIPEGWRECAPHGHVTHRLLPCKTFLGAAFDGRIEPHARWAPPMIRQVANGHVRLVVDLCATSRYYEPQELPPGVAYHKVLVPGRSVPPPEAVAEFVRLVDTYLTDPRWPNAVAAVHCTHGVNRTGYMIASYLVCRRQLSVRDALGCFTAARFPGMWRQELVDALHAQYGGPPPEPSAQPPPWADAERAGAAGAVGDELHAQRGGGGGGGGADGGVGGGPLAPRAPPPPMHARALPPGGMGVPGGGGGPLPGGLPPPAGAGAGGADMRQPPWGPPGHRPPPYGPGPGGAPPESWPPEWAGGGMPQRRM